MCRLGRQKAGGRPFTLSHGIGRGSQVNFALSNLLSFSDKCFDVESFLNFYAPNLLFYSNGRNVKKKRRENGKNLKLIYSI
jgi:hypothetical protein